MSIRNHRLRFKNQKKIGLLDDFWTTDSDLDSDFYGCELELPSIHPCRIDSKSYNNSYQLVNKAVFENLHKHSNNLSDSVQWFCRFSKSLVSHDFFNRRLNYSSGSSIQPINQVRAHIGHPVISLERWFFHDQKIQSIKDTMNTWQEENTPSANRRSSLLTCYNRF